MTVPTSTNRPRLVTTNQAIRNTVAQARTAGKSVGVVPTMGALHAGHLSLVEASTGECDLTVVTIYVNPTQFAPGEDYQRYPRTLTTDLEALSQYDVEWVFAPADDQLYPAGFSTYVEPPCVAKPLEGRCRPEHFRGVATVVLKLLNLTAADVAYFGQKDYQQSLVIRHMVRDLDLPIRISVCPIVREEDGLAVSSRNAYLNEHERVQALALSRSLNVAAELVAGGERDAATVVARMRQVLAEVAIDRVDYIAVVHPDTLAEVRDIHGPTLAAVAAHVGRTRLIDNRLIQ